MGNYLRAEVLFGCGLNPWAKVGQLKRREVTCLSRRVPELALRSYLCGATASDNDRERLKTDPALGYQQGREMGTRHLVFRRTNLPCLRCSYPIKQLRQTTSGDSTLPPSGDNILPPSADPSGNGTDEDRSRIIYFCPQCQQVEPSDSKPKWTARSRKAVAS